MKGKAYMASRLGQAQGKIMAANTPMLLKAGLVDGDVDSGVLASGQVVGVLDDLPTCDELVGRMLAEAAKTLDSLGSTGG